MAEIDRFEGWVEQGAQDPTWATQFPRVDFPMAQRAIFVVGRAGVAQLLEDEAQVPTWRRSDPWRRLEENQRKAEARVRAAEQGRLDPAIEAAVLAVFDPPRRPVSALPVPLARLLRTYLDFDPELAQEDRSDETQDRRLDVVRYASRGLYGPDADVPPYSGGVELGAYYQGVVPTSAPLLVVEAYNRWLWDGWLAQVYERAEAEPLPTPQAPSVQTRVQVARLARMDSMTLRGVYHSMAEIALSRSLAFTDANHAQWLLDMHADGPAWVLERLREARDLWELRLEPLSALGRGNTPESVRSWANDVRKDLDMAIAGPLLDLLGWEAPQEKSGVYNAPEEQAAPPDALQLADALEVGSLSPDQWNALAIYPVRTIRSIYYLEPGGDSAQDRFSYRRDAAQVQTTRSHKDRILVFRGETLVRLLRGETVPLIVPGVGPGHYYMDFETVKKRRLAEEQADREEQKEHARQVAQAIQEELRRREANRRVPDDDPQVGRYLQIMADVHGESPEDIRARMLSHAKTFVHAVRQEDRDRVLPSVERVENKVSRMVFSEMTGIKLPTTQKGTREALERWGRALSALDTHGYRWLSLAVNYTREGSSFPGVTYREPLLSIAEADQTILATVDYVAAHPEIALVGFVLHDKDSGEIIARYGPNGQRLLG